MDTTNVNEDICGIAVAYTADCVDEDELGMTNEQWQDAVNAELRRRYPNVQFEWAGDVSQALLLSPGAERVDHAIDYESVICTDPADWPNEPAFNEASH